MRGSLGNITFYWGAGRKNRRCRKKPTENNCNLDSGFVSI